ncbi:indole-3-glycerol-phosphate synthase [Geothrix sp. PMB-07]|uniref:indole-3-glycerol-phosphate synthase n=1 Tax=Geothrix sp. PMB-07 TaxID=3068640 RepID=UPI00274195D5|nr:indole-3-glycerol-phosphate synthase [Geothrix sp. PMB-07]WLT30150.1 indole-3-glycerol-phosphate synthase [Geothrix sp. PMB-07]
MSHLPDPANLVHGTGLSTTSHLQKVLVSELARLSQLTVTPLARQALSGAGPFETALRRDAAQQGGAVIAEYKQASPSLGPFAQGTPLLPQLRAYQEGGASAFSILAEPAYFKGSTKDLQAAAELGLPRLYKGFVIAEAQLAEAEATGAEAVLLIARVLKGHTAAFAKAARARGLEPLVELHDLTEVGFAQEAEARLVGINARDLSTFTLGEPTAAPLRRAFPDAVLIRESGLATPEDARAALRAGFDAVLIGEALMRSADPRGFLKRALAELRTEVS